MPPCPPLLLDVPVYTYVFTSDSLSDFMQLGSRYDSLSDTKNASSFASYSGSDFLSDLYSAWDFGCGCCNVSQHLKLAENKLVNCWRDRGRLIPVGRKIGKRIGWENDLHANRTENLMWKHICSRPLRRRTAEILYRLAWKLHISSLVREVSWLNQSKNSSSVEGKTKTTTNFQCSVY
jgi:hypothetical protein